MTRFLHHAALLAGLACIVWVGSGYIGSSHLLALAVTALIGAFFLLGALELQRYRQATATLAQALAGTATPPATLDGWLAPLHPTLRHPVRLRVQGQRVPLPGPALAPYLAGLLVLLGMLGTFLGMVVTLRGTGLALQGATDLASVRAALAAPVTGLGVAFGTSLAGVAASAMLGLMAALARRDRLQAGLQLDTVAAGALHAFSEAHRRDDAHRLLQQQAEALPQLVDSLRQLMQGMERQSEALHAQLQAGQHDFHQRTEAAYTGLAQAVDRSLKDSLAESARLAGAAIQPAVEATMAGVAREAAALHADVAHGVEQQLATLAQRFAASADGVAQSWTAALADQRTTQQQLGTQLRGTLDGFAQTFEQRSAALVAQVGTQLADSTGLLAERWQAALAGHAQTSEQLASGTRQALADTAHQFSHQAASLLQTVEQAHAQLQAQADARDAERQARWAEALAQLEQRHQAHADDAQQALAATASGFTQHAAELQQRVAQTLADLQAQAAERDAQRLTTWTDALARHEQATQTLAIDTRSALADTASALQQHAATLQAQAAERDTQRLTAWTEALARHEQATHTLGEEARQALAATAAGFADHTAALQQTVAQAHADLQAQAGVRDTAQLTAWDARLTTLAATLHAQWQGASADSLAQQQRICATLAETAQTITERAEQQASATVAEVGRLVDAAAAAPRAAAEVIAELRDKLTDSMARDNAMLDERARVLDTLRTLLDAVNHASTEQRAAIDALVDGSAQLLERAGARLAEQAQTQGDRLAEAATQLGTGAAEVASLGEAFGAAVQQFGQSNAQLGAQLAQLEQALGQQMARSDEQLAYYVAQAREVIDLSMLSQQQIVEDLQRMAQERAAALEPSEA